jgi:hypothetical protein
MIHQSFFKVFWNPKPFAIFATGEFAPNEVRRFQKKVLVGVRGQSPQKMIDQNEKRRYP